MKEDEILALFNFFLKRTGHYEAAALITIAAVLSQKKP